MGICYAEQQEWQAYETNYRARRKNRKKNDFNSIIYEQKSIHQSFVSKVENSFREDLHNTLNNIASDFGSIAFGSIVEMSEGQLEVLYKSLEQVNMDGQKFDPNQVVTLCNLKTKNYLHTHKIKHPCLKRYNEASACPYNSNHIIQYDLWKLIPLQPPNPKSYIYHPLTQSFLSVQQGKIVCGQTKHEWTLIDFGPRRNGGFIKIMTEQKGESYELCMTDQAGILQNHRKLELCREKHVGHLWELRFGECVME